MMRLNKSKGLEGLGVAKTGGMCNVLVRSCVCVCLAVVCRVPWTFRRWPSSWPSGRRTASGGSSKHQASPCALTSVGASQCE